MQNNRNSYGRTQAMPIFLFFEEGLPSNRLLSGGMLVSSGFWLKNKQKLLSVNVYLRITFIKQKVCRF